MENKKIPNISSLFHNELLPTEIKDRFYGFDKVNFFYDVGIQLEKLGNAFTNTKLMDNFSIRLSKNQQKELIKDYVIGFRKGYFEYENTNNFLIANDSLLTIHGTSFVMASMYNTRHLVFEGKVGEKHTSYDKGFENGKRYKAIEIILNNPYEFKDFLTLKKEAIKTNLENEVSIKEENNIETTFKSNQLNISSKIIMLEKLGILDFLKNKYSEQSTNSMAEILRFIIGAEAKTIQSYLYPIFNERNSQKNNPLNNHKNVSMINQILSEKGFEPK